MAVDLNRALTEVEQEVNGQNGKEYDIYVKNGLSGAKTKLYVNEANELSQVFEATAKEIGLNIGEKNNIYINSKEQSSTDPEMTLGEFNVTEDSVLTIQQDAKVAACK